MAWLIAAFAVAAWLMCGRYGLKLARRGEEGSPDKGLGIFIVFGPIMILVGFLELMDSGLRMTLADRRNPFRTELSEALRLFKVLQWVPGESAQKERNELRRTIHELRDWPNKLKGHDGDRLIAAMKAELETSKELSRFRLEAYEKIEREITMGVADEFSPSGGKQ